MAKLTAMARKELVECFNAKIKEFARDLTSLFPNDADIAAVKSGVAMSVLVDEAKPARLFHQHVTVPHGARLLARDEEFFLTADESEVTEEGDSAFGTSLIARLRTYWKEMGLENRAVVWSYFKVLVMLSHNMYSQ